MRSPLKSLSPFRSSTSVLALLLLAAAGCDDDECGVGDAPSDGLQASSADVALQFENLTFLAGNDCPDPNLPIGEPVSITLEGFQVGGSGRITICIMRPDLLTPGNARSIGTSASADIRIVDLHGDADNCSYTVDSSRPATGTASGRGVCADGLDPAGFSMNFDGALSLRRTCGATVDTIAVTLTGDIAVTERK